MQLDNYRALVMLYIVCFIHVLYWLGLGREPYLSIILVEMPAVFFISGASLSYRKGTRSLWQTFKNRFKRVVIPYYRYAFAMLVLLVLFTIVGSLIHIFFPSLFEKIPLISTVDICSYSMSDWWKVISFEDIPQLPFVWHLWFILPYLVLSCTFDIQKRLISHVNSHVYIVCCIFLFWVVQRYSDSVLLRNIFCYNIFIVGGYCCYKKLNLLRITALALLSAFILIGYIKIFGHDFVPMQIHKMLPDITFVLYNIFAMSLLGLFFSKVKIPQIKWLDVWNKKGYEFYLYQNIVFCIVALLLKYVYRHIPFVLLQIIACGISVYCCYMIPIAIKQRIK